MGESSGDPGVWMMVGKKKLCVECKVISRECANRVASSDDRNLIIAGRSERVADVQEFHE